MSMQQIWGRLRRFARSQEFGEWFRGEKRNSGAALHHAEELIREANERDRQEELKKFGPVSSETPPRKTEGAGSEREVKETEAYRAACRALGVAPDASLTRITAAYRAAMARHHPDRNGMNGEGALREATNRSQELNEAFGVVRRHHNR